MKTISADFNAVTEADHICLTTRGAQQEIHRQHLHPGDWVWLTDGELKVAAKIASDPRYELVGVPSWATLVDVLDAEDIGVERIWSELQELLAVPLRDDAQNRRLFQLLNLFEGKAPDAVKALVPPGYLRQKRAAVLAAMGQPELAVLEIEDALQSTTDDPACRYLTLKLLARLDLDRAAMQVTAILDQDDSHALLLAAAIAILGARAETAPDAEFPAIAEQILAGCERFDSAPGRDEVRASILAEVLFEKGMALLRLGRMSESQDALGQASRIDPVDPVFREALELHAYDERARTIAGRVRDSSRAA